MMIPIVIGALETSPKSLEKVMEKLEIGGRAEVIPTALLASTSILSRVLET